jgi:hypothetical protein
MDSRKRESDEEEQTFLPKLESNEDVATGFSTVCLKCDANNPRKRGLVWYLRLFLEIAMAATLVYLLVAKPLVVSRHTLRRTPVPDCRLAIVRRPVAAANHRHLVPRKIYTFQDNPKYLRGDMWFNETLTLHTLHNWIELSSGT